MTPITNRGLSVPVQDFKQTSNEAELEILREMLLRAATRHRLGPEGTEQFVANVITAIEHNPQLLMEATGSRPRDPTEFEDIATYRSVEPEHDPWRLSPKSWLNRLAHMGVVSSVMGEVPMDNPRYIFKEFCVQAKSIVRHRLATVSSLGIGTVIGILFGSVPWTLYGYLTVLGALVLSRLVPLGSVSFGWGPSLKNAFRDLMVYSVYLAMVAALLMVVQAQFPAAVPLVMNAGLVLLGLVIVRNLLSQVEDWTADEQPVREQLANAVQALANRIRGRKRPKPPSAKAKSSTVSGGSRPTGVVPPVSGPAASPPR